MTKNDVNTVVIIFALTVLDYKTPIPEAVVDTEEMVVVVVVVAEAEAVMIVEDTVMVQLAIDSVVAVTVNFNLWPLGNICLSVCL